MDWTPLRSLLNRRRLRGSLPESNELPYLELSRAWQPSNSERSSPIGDGAPANISAADRDKASSARVGSYQIQSSEAEWPYSGGERKKGRYGPPLVSDFINTSQGCWDVDKLNQVLFPIDVQEITKIPILQPNQAGTIYWANNDSGIFSVKEAYKVYMGMQSSPPENPSSSDHMKEAFRFLWQLLSGSKNQTLPVAMLEE